MHNRTPAEDALIDTMIAYSRERVAMDPPPLDHALDEPTLRRLAGGTITEDGYGGERAFRLFSDVLAPACLSADHPGYLSFIPPAPTEAAIMFDLVMSASSLYGGSWQEGSGAVFAENETLAWLAREVGLPEGAGGTFVQGGTIGNLSALVAAREKARRARTARGLGEPERWYVLGSAEAHSSIASAARVMDATAVPVPVDERGKLTGEAVAAVLDDPEGPPTDAVFAVVATAGTTNFGIVDDLDSVGKVARERGVWFHVDGAYGLAGILSDEARPLYRGAERADSFIVDPHKWLFAPFDACALVYRNPEDGRLAHTQHAEYLDTLETGEYNPSDYAIHLTRRPRGLPLWFSVATHGVGAYREAITHTIRLAHDVAEEISRHPKLRLVRQPELSVVVFQRVGWEQADYDAWSQRLLDDGVGFVVPSSFQGEPVLRFAILNPKTTRELVTQILDRLG